MTVKPIAVLLTDTHLFEKRTKEDEFIDCNFDVVFNCFKQAIQTAIKNNLTEVYHLGDIFHSRKNQSQSLLQMFDQILELFQFNNIDLVLIPGNHDKTDYSAKYSFLFPFKGKKNLILYNEYQDIDIIEGIRFHLIPFFENDIYLQEIHKTNLLKNGKNVLLTHIGLHGVLNNKEEKEPSSIIFEMFEKFDKVLIGHFHESSSHYKNKIHYIGSAYQHNFGEDTKKGIIVLNSDLSFHREKTDFKEYQTTEIDVSNITNTDIEDLVELQKTTYQRIILTGDETLLKAFNKNKLLETGIKVNIKPVKYELEKIEQKLDSFDENSILQNFKDFCDENSYKEAEGLVYLKKVT
jgi:exonuclease SbcD